MHTTGQNWQPGTQPSRLTPPEKPLDPDSRKDYATDMTTTTDTQTIETTAMIHDRITKSKLNALIDDIDGTLDSIVGDAEFSDAQVRETLESIARRCQECIASLK